MDNVLRRTIRSEVETILEEKKEKTHIALEPPLPKKIKKTEQRLSTLLSKIRTKSENTKRLIKKLHIKYERYCPEFSIFKSVKAKDGGGSRFIEIEQQSPINFLKIRQIASELYFDNDDCNNFFENKLLCNFEIVTVSGHTVKEEEDLWDFLKRKGMCISKTVFILRSKLYCNDDTDDDTDDDLPTAFQTAHDNSNDSNANLTLTAFSSSRPSSTLQRICPICNCTTMDDDNDCLICLQNYEFENCLKQDTEIRGEDLATSNTFDSSVTEFISPLEENLPNIDELREIRIDTFGNNKKEVKIKVNRLKMKADLVREFQENKVRVFFL